MLKNTLIVLFVFFSTTVFCAATGKRNGFPDGDSNPSKRVANLASLVYQSLDVEISDEMLNTVMSLTDPVRELEALPEGDLRQQALTIFVELASKGQIRTDYFDKNLSHKDVFKIIRLLVDDRRFVDVYKLLKNPPDDPIEDDLDEDDDLDDGFFTLFNLLQDAKSVAKSYAGIERYQAQKKTFLFYDHYNFNKYLDELIEKRAEQVFQFVVTNFWLTLTGHCNNAEHRYPNDWEGECLPCLDLLKEIIESMMLLDGVKWSDPLPPFLNVTPNFYPIDFALRLKLYRQYTSPSHIPSALAQVPSIYANFRGTLPLLSYQEYFELWSKMVSVNNYTGAVVLDDKKLAVAAFILQHVPTSWVKRPFVKHLLLPLLDRSDCTALDSKNPETANLIEMLEGLKTLPDDVLEKNAKLEQILPSYWKYQLKIAAEKNPGEPLISDFELREFRACLESIKNVYSLYEVTGKMRFDNKTRFNFSKIDDRLSKKMQFTPPFFTQEFKEEAFKLLEFFTKLRDMVDGKRIEYLTRITSLLCHHLHEPAEESAFPLFSIDKMKFLEWFSKKMESEDFVESLKSADTICEEMTIQHTDRPGHKRVRVDRKSVVELFLLTMTAEKFGLGCYDLTKFQEILAKASFSEKSNQNFLKSSAERVKQAIIEEFEARYDQLSLWNEIMLNDD